MELPFYKKEHTDNLENELGATPIPINFFKKSGKSDVFQNKIEENHAIEQFFWTEQVVEKLKKSLELNFIEEVCGLMSPSLIHSLSQEGRDEVLLDIDKRFSYLPKYRFYDVMHPQYFDNSFRLLVIDPPFFFIPIEMVAKTVDLITEKNYNSKILIAFIKRGEQRLRKAFKNYKLYPTKFKLEYVSIKENKWKNFCLYSNIDLPGIKRIIDC